MSARGQVRQCIPNSALPASFLLPRTGLIGMVIPFGQVTVWASQVDVELVLGEHPARRDGWLDLRHRLDPGVLELLQDVSGAVGRVAIDRSRVIGGSSAGLPGRGW